MTDKKHMENIREQQEEALKAMFDYNKKLVPALEEVAVELKGAQKGDTKEYLNHILKGVNWVIEVVNGTRDFINEEKEIVNKEHINNIINELNTYMKEENNIKVAEVIENGIIPFVNLMSKSAKELAKIEEN